MIDPALPLVDLHRHLEGSIRLETVLELSEKYHLPLPEGGLEGLQTAVWMSEPTSDILKIMPKFDLLRQVYVDYEVCRRVTRECIQDAVDEGLDYVELRFSPLFMAELHQSGSHAGHRSRVRCLAGDGPAVPAAVPPGRHPFADLWSGDLHAGTCNRR